MQRSTLLLIIVAVLGLSMVISLVLHQILKVRTAFAEDQVSIIYEARQKAFEATTPTQAVGFLEYAIDYYPSGTKQTQNSRLDRLVELVRSNVVSDIITDLKKKTGQDFGNEPTNWFRHYPPPRP